MRSAIVILALLANFNAYSETSMEKVLASKKTPSCSNELIVLAESTIGKNKHRLMEFSPLNARLNETFVSGIIQYKDRQSHVAYSAAKNALGKCFVNFQETFTVKNPCILVREEIFKKWQFQGKLSNKTMVLKSIKSQKLTAFLSDAADGSYCLVSRHKSN